MLLGTCIIAIFSQNVNLKKFEKQKSRCIKTHVVCYFYMLFFYLVEFYFPLIQEDTPLIFSWKLLTIKKYKHVIRVHTHLPFCLRLQYSSAQHCKILFHILILFFLLKKNWIKYHSSWLLWCTECLCPPKFICWNPNIQCDGIRKWGFGKGHLGGALLNGIGALIKGSPESSPTLFSALWGHNENSAVCNRQVGHHQNPIMLAPWL